MKKMKLFHTIGLAVAVLTAISSCKKYESFETDYDYTAVYFASQKPLRTIVAYDQMQFKVGVALAGVRENNREETVTYTIDPTLLTSVAGAGVFKLLPANYYTISSPDKMVVPKGGLIGDVTVTLNRDLFTADPEALTNTYALPLRIVSSTTDSVLRGNATISAKDYTILVVKYISPQHGTYYHKGIQEKVNDLGNVLETVRYTNKDLIRNTTWDLSTLSLNEVRTTGVGNKTNASLRLLTAPNQTVSINAVSGAAVTTGNGTYDPSKREYYLQYSFTQGSGATLERFSVKDTLILRQPPEKDLRFEEW